MNLTGSNSSCDCLRSIKSKKLLFILAVLFLFYTFAGKEEKNNQFDYFVFSQRWLPTACIEYTEHGSSSTHPKFCTLPKNYDFWVIHGLWPTQNDHMGPFFCNRSMPFDISKLRPIESVLESYWPNIEGGKPVESLWQHEWEKHGTCAAELESLNSEIKYFSATLKLFKTHNLEALFKEKNIIPSLKPEISVPDLFNIIQSSFGKLPQIHCVTEVKKKQPYLSEIRLCYDKNLELMDCRSIHGIKLNSKLDIRKTLTNCPVGEKIVFPNTVDLKLRNKLLKQSEKADHSDLLFNILGIVRFLQWASI